MPPPDDTSRLYHILDSAHKAVRFIDRKSRSDMDRDELLALGLVRLLEVIGEALHRYHRCLPLQAPRGPVAPDVGHT
jgi:uncharacterized protein with HEPN domain